MNYEKMWKDLMALMIETEKMTKQVETNGILNVMTGIEKQNTEYEALPF